VRKPGLTVILSDGDVVFQPCKVEHAGLSDAVDGPVLIYIRYKEAFDNVERRYPAKQHVLADEKLRILIAVKQFWAARNERVPAPGSLCSRPRKWSAPSRPADVTIECIKERDLLRPGTTSCSLRLAQR
jgi:hypothetical protein